MATNIKIQGVDLEDIIAERVQAKVPTKTSELTNDSSFTTSTGTAASATNVTSATTITASSGVSSGAKGPTANVTINRTSGSISVPQITVKANGTISSVTVRTFSLSTS